MVYAVCAVRREFLDERADEARAIEAALVASRDRCAAHPLETAAAAAQLYDFSDAYLDHYFDQLKYGFTAEYRRGLARVLPPRRRHRRARRGAESRHEPTDEGDAAALEAIASCPARLSSPRASDDWERVVAVMPEWWGGRDLRDLLPRIFFEHFSSTSFVAERRRRSARRVPRRLSVPDHDDEAYVHFVGVEPAWRRAGLARRLYERFFEVARADTAGRRARAVTAVVNKRLDRLPPAARLRDAARRARGRRPARPPATRTYLKVPSSGSSCG